METTRHPELGLKETKEGSTDANPQCFMVMKSHLSGGEPFYTNQCLQAV